MKEKETVTMLPMEEIMKSVEQYVKEGKIGFFTEEDTTEKTEPITIPVTKIRLKYYIDETARWNCLQTCMEFLLSLPMEGFTRRTGIVLYRRRNRSFDPGRIWMVDMKNKFYGEGSHG